MADHNLKEIIQKFELLQKQDLNEAVKYVNGDPSVSSVIRQHIASQVQPQMFSPVVFQWLYNCVQLKQHCEDLYTFSLSFVPDLILVYLHAVYANSTQLKANSEALLLAMVLETEKEKVPPVQVPVLSKPSLYHQSSTQVSQPSLTEAALQRHNQAETPPSRPTFNSKEITVNNRLVFLSTVMDAFNDRLMLFLPDTRIAFCNACVRLAMQGMGKLCIQQVTLDDIQDQDWAINNKEDLSAMQRYSLNDALVSSLLRGARICMFQCCHIGAVKALHALKARAEYEMLTSAIQASHSLMRMLKGPKATKFRLQLESYAGEGEFATEPSKIHSHLNSSILCSNLSESVQTPCQAEAYGTLKEPHNQKLLTSSGVSPQTKSTAV